MYVCKFKVLSRLPFACFALLGEGVCGPYLTMCVCIMLTVCVLVTRLDVKYGV